MATYKIKIIEIKEYTDCAENMEELKKKWASIKNSDIKLKADKEKMDIYVDEICRV